ncbi:OmpR Response regulators consisting of a CheY-like receiver domain and a winged-helix DNA-binding domain [Caulobacteraceae bacterium]
MAASNLNGSAIFNLGKAVVMVVDDNSFSMNLTIQTLMGFGAKARHQCPSAAAAMETLKTTTVDLLIVDSDMPDIDGYDLVRWLRSSGMDPNAFVPVIMIAGHTPASKVTKARDCGANFIVARPLSARVLLERILWVARDPRPMLQTGDYTGPDRRFRDGDPPVNTSERRRDRLSAAEAAAVEAGDEPQTPWSSAAFKGAAR